MFQIPSSNISLYSLYCNLVSVYPAALFRQTKSRSASWKKDNFSPVASAPKFTKKRGYCLNAWRWKAIFPAASVIINGFVPFLVGNFDQTHLFMHSLLPRLNKSKGKVGGSCDRGGPRGLSVIYNLVPSFLTWLCSQLSSLKCWIFSPQNNLQSGLIMLVANFDLHRALDSLSYSRCFYWDFTRLYSIRICFNNGADENNANILYQSLRVLPRILYNPSNRTWNFRRIILSSSVQFSWCATAKKSNEKL